MTTVIAWTKRINHPVRGRVVHIANEITGRASKLAIIRRVRAGVSPGFPDLLVPWPSTGPDGRLYHALFVEMKVGAGKLRENQADWLLWLRQAGYAAECCHGIEETIGVISAYLGLK